MEHFEKKNFFGIPPKILHNINIRSHKKFWAKKMIFRGAFRGGLSERKKIQSGVWCGLVINQGAGIGEETGDWVGKWSF